MNEVILNQNELYVAAIIGVRRQITSMNSKECNKIQNKDFGWHIDIESACAELAFAKYKKMYWDFSVNTFKHPDVGEFQVRHTRDINGKLKIREKDRGHEKYFLVVGTSPSFNVVGWIMGKDAKNEKHIFKGFNGMPDCWMVAQEHLIKEF